MNLDDATARCLACNSPLWAAEIQAGRLACFRCEGRASEQLHAIRGTFKRLDTVDGHTKVRGGGTSGPTGSKEPPIPARLAVLNATGPGGVVAQLQSGIEDSWRKTLGWSMAATRSHRDIDGVTTFLINNLPWACEKYPEIADDLEAISSIHGTLTGMETGERGPRKFTAYCSTDDCHGEMRITLWTARATCPTCRTDYDKAGLGTLVTEYDKAAA
ncbi:hypothetical protein AB0M68_03765 [Streptomyces sp. NPDC051453]|uniref:hypothetical protein n=1 Tax=Streptomyces sp. NPDC051453 TaxID=3154941 RepID=UPI00344A4019